MRDQAASVTNPACEGVREEFFNCDTPIFKTCYETELKASYEIKKVISNMR